MTQRSQPQAGYYDAVTLPDCGPYSADQWAALLGALQRAGVVLSTVGPLQIDTAFNDVGVFYAVDNQLEVTSAGANTININTGAAMVAGRLVPSDTALVFTVPINRTNDLIVVRQNWSAATYTPPASVDADEQVPPKTARVTRVTALVNDATLATYWDIPLADFTTDGAGAVTLNSDDRVYVDAMTKTFYVQTSIESTTGGESVQGYFLPNSGGLETTGGRTQIPTDFIKDMLITPVVIPNGTGAVALNTAITYGACGEASAGGTHADYNPGFAAYTNIAVANLLYECVMPVTLASPTIGDLLTLQIARNSGAGGDTLAAELRAHGFIVQYFGWGRR